MHIRRIAGWSPIPCGHLDPTKDLECSNCSAIAFIINHKDPVNANSGELPSN